MTQESEHSDKSSIIEDLLRIILIASIVGGIGSIALSEIARMAENTPLAELTLEFFKLMLPLFFVSGIGWAGKKVIDSQE